MDGISKDSINKMFNYLCPFCYIPPAQNISPRSDICFTCKNTNNLRSLALWQEIQLISDKVNELQTVSANLEKINETIAKGTLLQNNAEGKISSQEDNMKKIEELKELAKNFEYQTKLLEDSQSKTYANVLCAPTTSGLSPNSTPVRKSLPTPSALKDKLIHSEKSIADTRNSFLDVQTLKHVEEFLNSELRKDTFEKKNGHHVLNLGRQYLNKEKKTNNDNPEHVSIPDPLKNVLDKIYSEFDGEYDLNCVLVKHLSEGSDSHLTDNTFDYCTINPDLQIFRLSIGEPRKLAFVDLSTKEVVQDYMCHSNSLYLMSRHSQNFFHTVLIKLKTQKKLILPSVLCALISVLKGAQ